MTGKEIREEIRTKGTPSHCCVKSWGKNRTFVDFEKIDRFVEEIGEETSIEGLELLDLEQMWQALTELDPDRLARVKRPEGEIIEWLWADRNGTEKVNRYPFSSDGIMTIMNEEFFA